MLKQKGKYNEANTRENLRRRLTPLQYEVTQNKATEPPFENAYWNNSRKGIYIDVVTGKPLFSSMDQFDSGSGWPSFTKPIGQVIEKIDRSYNMNRIEIRNYEDTSHLGHVFDDGPKHLGGKRYCINSLALEFIPFEEMEKAGYGEYMSLFGEEE